MPRYIPIELQDHLSQESTTTCLLMRVDPVTHGYSSYGVTNLDRHVDYDDLLSSLRYSAVVGLQSTSIQGGANLSVDNAEGTSLLPEYDVPLNEQDIRAGVYDFARFRIYLINYADTTPGRHIELLRGTLGKMTIDADGLSVVKEFRGLIAALKQSVCEKDSLTCRATYGSQPEGSSTPGPIERFPCGKDATAELIEGAVTSVGLENTLTFTVSDFELEDDELNPGIVKWVTGMNAGRTYEIDTNTDAGEITLAFETAFPIQVGDQLEYRADCNKLARDTEKGCKAPHHWGSDWPLHFRGEPDIPIGDAGAMETPGASSSPGTGAYTSQPFETEAE